MEETLPGVTLGTNSLAQAGLLGGWSDLTNINLLLDMLVVLSLALVLGATIAYHPSTRRRVTSLEMWDQPKAILLYSLVAAVVALLVQVQPAMALVIFGIGGLLRFRTVVGAPHHTARVILVTVIGLCCGLKVFVVAIPTTLIGWLLIFTLNFQRVGILNVSGVTEENIFEATEAYRNALTKAGCKLVGERARVFKREFRFVIKVPSGLDTDDLKEQFAALPEHLRGIASFSKV